VGYLALDLLQNAYKLKLMNEDLFRIVERADQLVESHLLLMRQLVALRKQNSLSQELVGTRMGVSQPAVAAFEGHESNPTLSSIRRYALAVGARIEHKVIDDLEIIASSVSGCQEVSFWLSQATPENIEISFTTPVRQTSNA
jgi:transcriptional regulator with XRE-family HTH domain